MSRNIPRTIRPMLAKGTLPFDSEDHIFELKWDGTRCIAFVGKDKLRLQNRRLVDITFRYPELQSFGDALGTGTVLDGEIVVLEGGRPSFRRLQEREQITDPDKISIRSGLLPATYVVFDLLYHKGRSLLKKPLEVRRRELEGLFPLTDNVILSETYESGKKLFSMAIKRGFEGVMAKAKKSPYLPGTRSGHWLKVKKSADMDAVVCGYTEGSGRRKETFGSLVICAYEDERLRYLGRVGTGFDERTLDTLSRLLKKIETKRPTVTDVARTTMKIHWTRPEFVVRVGYQERTRDGSLRVPVFKGLRDDKPPRECLFR